MTSSLRSATNPLLLTTIVSTIIRQSHGFSYISSLSESLNSAYNSLQTDGILQLIKQQPQVFQQQPSELISSCIQSSTTNTGSIRKDQLSGTVNALIASSTSPTIATNLLDAFDDSLPAHGVHPDIVTLSCAYAASNSPAILNRAIKLSKKASGSKRRRALASSKRRPVSSSLPSLAEWGIAVLYEDDDYIGLNKPSGMACYHKRRTGGKKTDPSLEDILTRDNVPLSTISPEGRGIVHRLDRGTSGCILLAKTDEGHARLLREFFVRGVAKRYLTLLPGPVLGETEGVIDCRVAGRPARSRYSVRDVLFGDDDEGEKEVVAMTVSMQTSTGRKHQVRVHCAEALGRPVFLDGVYGKWDGDGNWRVPQCIKDVGENDDKRFFLHAEELSVDRFGIKMTAELPSWWVTTLESLNDKTCH